MSASALQKRNKVALLDDDDDDDQFTDDETTPLNNMTNHEEQKPWDPFRTMPPEDLTGSLANKKAVEAFSAIAKFLAYILTFIVLLTGAVISKGTLLFMTSQIKVRGGQPNQTHEYCSTRAGRAIEASVSMEERVGWLWAIFFCFLVPEFLTWTRSLRICIFRTWKAPSLAHFSIVTLFETLHIFGIALFVYTVLPNLKVVEGIMLTNCFCLVPGVLNMLSRNQSTSQRYLKLTLDTLAILAQLSGLILWAALDWTTSNWNVVWILPFALLFGSFGWWENYVERTSPIGIVRYLAKIKEDLKSTRYFSYVFLSVWRSLVFFLSLLGIEWVSIGKVDHLFSLFYAGFEEHPYNVTEIQVPSQSTSLLSLLSTATKVVTNAETFTAWPYTAAYVFAIHAGCTLVCGLAGKFACKIRIQGIGFALPISLAVPVTISLLITFCGLRMGNACMFSDVIPPHLFFDCPTGGYLIQILANQHAWAWVLWILSQAWITAHIWRPKCGRLASTEKLFVTAYYNAFLIDQSMAMNRRRDDERDVKTDDVANLKAEGDAAAEAELSQQYYYGDGFRASSFSSSSGSSSRDSGDHHNALRSSIIHPSDSITRIYVCATMWHETIDETVTFLKSIFYLDEDQSARRVAQKYLMIVDPDYYEIETHIFFDDAFELSDDDDDEMVVNTFVKMLIDCMDVAASHVHQTNVKIRAPKKFPTPYGGRLVWTLPGKTKIICHLKDKQKIRNRKRWSQVMYMYYLLGHKLMELPIPVDRKAVIAQNTYLLALDGDIDFVPSAVLLLIDSMKRNQNLAAACGRIHPVGEGLMAWYQSFEYAIGHWLQKSTEHVIGCVLCSPGCFSLFRGACLMDDNVMAKYTTTSHEARHYVQYDQGEDRWLCTLLLQRGYRVEYCAASDAFTHCPEGFDEFYNQRRRWVPSTMANIMDLLGDYKRTIKVNDNLSFPYIIYQGVLMVGTILGPGTIFLMIVGSINVVFGLSQWASFLWNLFPIMAYVIICMTCKAKFQVWIAQLLSVVYAIIMMAVLVGLILQLNQDGWESPSSIFFLMTAGTFIFSAILHPQEFWCLPTGLIYYLTVPSMYLLLIIYSVCNLNNVSWGTREAPVKKKKADAAKEAAAAAEASKKKGKGGNPFMAFFQSDAEKKDDEGSIEFSLAGLFKIMCCVHRKPDNGEKAQLLIISDQLNALNKRLDSIERVVNPQGSLTSGRKSISSRSSMRSGMGPAVGAGIMTGLGVETNLSIVDEDGDDENSMYDGNSQPESEINEVKEERDNLSNPYWLEDKTLTRGTVDFLTGGELQFWKDMIEKYLSPIDENKEEQAKIAAALKDLRNTVVFTFFIINALYVTAVFLLTLQKDSVYIRWPLGIKYNISYAYYDPPSLPTVSVGKEYLQLEPIGLCFVFFFASVMAIQFTAMLFHRFGTLSQILANTELNLCAKKIDDSSDDAFLAKNGVEIARGLQQLKGVDDHDQDDGRNERVGRRRTIHNLERQKSTRQVTGDMESAFRKRLDSIGPNGTFEDFEDGPGLSRSMSVRRDTIKLLQANSGGGGRKQSNANTVLAEVRRRSSFRVNAYEAKRASRRRSTLGQQADQQTTDFSE